MMMLVIGMLVGVVGWQVVCYALAVNDREEWSYPIVDLVVWFCHGVVAFFGTFKYIQLFPMFFKHGINPFCMKIKDMKERLSDEEKERILEVSQLNDIGKRNMARALGLR